MNWINRLRQFKWAEVEEAQMMPCGKRPLVSSVCIKHFKIPFNWGISRGSEMLEAKL